MQELLEYAQRALDNACKGEDNIADIRYWAGYIDGLRAAMRKKEDTDG